MSFFKEKDKFRENIELFFKAVDVVQKKGGHGDKSEVFGLIGGTYVNGKWLYENNLKPLYNNFTAEPDDKYYIDALRNAMMEFDFQRIIDIGKEIDADKVKIQKKNRFGFGER